MLEYVFFDPRPRDGFLEFLLELGLQPVVEEQEDLIQVSLPEDLEEALALQIEDHYDRMMALDRSLYETEAAPGEVGYQAAGITLALQDGSNVYAEVSPDLLGRIMQVLSPQEFNQVVNAIVQAVENPDARSLCQRMRDVE